MLYLSVDEVVLSCHPLFYMETPSQEAPCTECLHNIDCTLRQKPTEQSNILWQQLLRASVANSVAISPKESTRQSPAKHNHSQQSRLSYFLIILSRDLKMQDFCLYIQSFGRDGRWNVLITKVYLFVKLCGLCLVPKLHLICQRYKDD